jgi:type 1 glutamine amidotransferase
MKKISIILSLAAVLLLVSVSCNKQSGYKTLILTGQNTGNWEESSPVLKQILEQSGLFSCDIVTSPVKGGDMSSFNPKFSKYKLVVLDYNGDSWSDKTKAAFVDYVKNGGGVVVYKEASLSFPDWKEYSEICGVGGHTGTYVYYRGNKVVMDSSSVVSFKPGPKREVEVRGRKMDHAIMKGLPYRWVHGTDIIYNRLRGPAKNLEILATAFCDTTGGGSGKDEPVLMTVTYGKGRIFHTTLGFADVNGGPAMECAGFITTLQRGAEWAVTGNVTQPVPADFPSAAGTVIRTDLKVITLEDDFANIVNYGIDKTTRYYTDLQSHIRKASGNPEEMLKLEKRMVEVLKSTTATVDSKKLMLRELSWMGSEYSVPAIKELAATADLKDEAEFALERLK